MDYQLVISGTIGSWWNGCSSDYVRYVLNNNKGKDVHVGFCSLGGYVKDGLEMHQAFKDHGKVHAHAFGMNASISTIAMLGCSSIDIVKGSFFLIHNVSVWIEKFEQANKEALDRMIEQLKFERENLKTFDDVLAAMYADKTGKTVDECLAQMKKGNWLTAQQALDFGLVDSIREDASTEKAAIEYNTSFKNNYDITFKDAGIPPLPETTEDTSRLNVVDENGYPTQSFLQKTWQGLKNLLCNHHADNLFPNNMNKIFVKIQDILNVQALETDEKGNIILTSEQATSVENALKDQNNKIADSEKTLQQKDDEIANLKAKVQKLENESKQKDEEIKTLKNGAGDTTEDKTEMKENTISSIDLYNSVKDI